MIKKKVEPILYGIVENLELNNPDGEKLIELRTINIVEEDDVEDILTKLCFSAEPSELDNVQKPEVYILTKVPVFKNYVTIQKTIPGFTLKKEDSNITIGFKNPESKKNVSKKAKKESSDTKTTE